MKTRQEWLEQHLDIDQYAQAVENIKLLNDEDVLKDQVEDFHAALYGAFIFDDSPQGYEYWHEIFTSRNMLIDLYPKLQPPRTPFEQEEMQRYHAEEYGCAWAFLDKHGVPTEAKNGENYSLVGRIQLYKDGVRI